MIEILGLLFILGINLVSFVLNMAGLDCLLQNVIGLCFFFFLQFVSNFPCFDQAITELLFCVDLGCLG